MDKQDFIKRSAAKLIASLYIMDKMNNNVWQNSIIQVITDNVQHSDPQVQKASLFTLNYICESLD